jgi:hypothetical protein
MPLNKKTAFLSEPDFVFDWYECTLDPEQNVFFLFEHFSYLAAPEVARPLHGYEFCFDFGGQAKLLYGGHTGQYGPHVIIHGGDGCQKVVDGFRLSFPEHRPSRVDCKIDFCFDGAFDALFDICLKASEEFGVKNYLYGDYLNREKGRTLYLGGKQSTHKLRLYEKGHEQREKGIDPEANLKWVRLEFQISPDKRKRHMAASLSASELARSSRWTSFICQQIGSKLGKGVSMCTTRKTPEVISSLEHMLKQYSSVLNAAVKEKYLDRIDVHNAVDECIDTGAFTGFPESVRRNWYF